MKTKTYTGDGVQVISSFICTSEEYAPHVEKAVDKLAWQKVTLAEAKDIINNVPCVIPW